jgi:hypothetical protein
VIRLPDGPLSARRRCRHRCGPVDGGPVADAGHDAAAITDFGTDANTEEGTDANADASADAGTDAG